MELLMSDVLMQHITRRRHMHITQRRATLSICLYFNYYSIFGSLTAPTVYILFRIKRPRRIGLNICYIITIWVICIGYISCVWCNKLIISVNCSSFKSAFTIQLSKAYPKLSEDGTCAWALSCTFSYSVRRTS